MTFAANLSSLATITANLSSLATASANLISFSPPSWITSTRPVSPNYGQMGWNSTLGQLEGWAGSQWQQITSLLYSVSYLAVAGGGGGGGASSGGSGGGGGGSGVVIISIPTLQYTGVTTGSPTITTSGTNTILKFTSSGTFVS
jgi:hypothetical protein